MACDSFTKNCHSEKGKIMLRDTTSKISLVIPNGNTKINRTVKSVQPQKLKLPIIEKPMQSLKSVCVKKVEDIFCNAAV